MSMKKMIGGAGLALILVGALAGVAHADPGMPGPGPGFNPPGPGGPAMNLNQRVDQLEHEMMDLRGQVDALQQRVNTLTIAPPAPPAPVVIDCTISDTLGQSFLGKGPNQLQATYNAQQACGQKYGGSTTFCTGAAQCQQE
jgi:hypothetical protein